MRSPWAPPFGPALGVDDVPPRLATLHVTVVDLDASAAGGPRWMAIDKFAACVDDALPRWVSLSGRPDVLAHPALPTLVGHAVRARVHCEVRTDATQLDPGRAWALLGAGLSRLTLVLTRPHSEARGVRNLERLVAMRDANRKPVPVARVEWWLNPAVPDGWADAMARWGDRVPEAPPVLRLVSRPNGAEQARRVRDELQAARRQASALRLRASVAAIDRILDGMSGDPRACRAPWHTAGVGVDGTVFPCARHRDAGPFGAAWGPGPLGATVRGPAARAFRSTLLARSPRDPVCASCADESLRGA